MVRSSQGEPVCDRMKRHWSGRADRALGPCRAGEGVAWRHNLTGHSCLSPSRPIAEALGLRFCIPVRNSRGNLAKKMKDFSPRDRGSLLRPDVYLKHFAAFSEAQDADSAAGVADHQVAALRREGQHRVPHQLRLGPGRLDSGQEGLPVSVSDLDGPTVRPSAGASPSRNSPTALGNARPGTGSGESAPRNSTQSPRSPGW
jgi:hypothetical protein